MGGFGCSACRFIYDEEKKGGPFVELDVCPVRRQPATAFEALEEEVSVQVLPAAEHGNSLEYEMAYARVDDSYRHMKEIHEMAVSGRTIIEAMGARMSMPNWDDTPILGAQLNPPPLMEHDEVDTTTIIGTHARKPMVLKDPVHVSHMSFGTLSRETKIALAKGSAMTGSVMCSGESGILPEEIAAADKYIFEYVSDKYSVTPENLQNADAIETKIGQGTEPGMGGRLPAGKVTPEISQIRNKPMGHDIISPSKFKDIRTKDDLKNLVSQLRLASDDRPIGIKITAGGIEKDLEFCVYAEPDFIIIDGRDGATGASPRLVRDATSVPTVYALHRARKYLDEVGADTQLVITGGPRVSSDFVKAIAIGADAVVIVSAALMAAAYQQYRICGIGMCPVGVVTQDPELCRCLNGDAAAIRVASFLSCSLEELKTFARITGHERLHDMNVDDLCTINREVSEYASIRHA